MLTTEDFDKLRHLFREVYEPIRNDLAAIRKNRATKEDMIRLGEGQQRIERKLDLFLDTLRVMKAALRTQEQRIEALETRAGWHTN